MNLNEGFSDLLNKPERFFGRGPWVIASAPGRADFLNTHQDYKGLPVVPVGINLRTFIFARFRNDDVFTIKSLNLEELEEPSIDMFRVAVNEMQERDWFGNYFRGVINVLVKRGDKHKLRGMDAIVKSQIPIGSGLSSSAALEISFLKLLNHACDLGYTNRDLAELAYLAETTEVGVPCGRLDQYGSVYGGVIKLECRPPFHVEQLPFANLIFAIIDSGIRHATAEIHPARQREISEGLGVLMESGEVPAQLKLRLGRWYDEPLWERIYEGEITPYLSLLDEKGAKRILYTLKAQKSTEFGLRILRKESINRGELIAHLGAYQAEKVMRKPFSERSHWILGEVMNQQHELLRDFYDVSLPELEKIREAAIEAGAYGVKISGAGLGGSLIALVKDFKTGWKVVRGGLSAGGKQGWVSEVAPGARIEKPLR
jgi:galactokinase